MTCSTFAVIMNKKLKGETTKTEEMSFLDHLEVLRWHIIRSVIAVISIAIVVFSLGKTVFEKIIFAPKDPNFISYKFFCGISDATCLSAPKLVLNKIVLGEVFFTHIKVSVFLGIAISMPYIIWEVWKFIKPGLYDNERKHARGFVGVSSFLFILGISFGYYIVTPFAVSFLSNYTLVEGAVTETTSLSSYVSYLTMFTFPSGILFQLPILVYFLTKIGVITPKFLKTYRRHAYVVLLVLSAVITPPDVVSQILICIPLYILYEISILISKRVYKKSLEELA